MGVAATGESYPTARSQRLAGQLRPGHHKRIDSQPARTARVRTSHHLAQISAGERQEPEADRTAHDRTLTQVQRGHHQRAIAEALHVGQVQTAFIATGEKRPLGMLSQAGPAAAEWQASPLRTGVHIP